MKNRYTNSLYFSWNFQRGCSTSSYTECRQIKYSCMMKYAYRIYGCVDIIIYNTVKIPPTVSFKINTCQFKGSEQLFYSSQLQSLVYQSILFYVQIFGFTHRIDIPQHIFASCVPVDMPKSQQVSRLSVWCCQILNSVIQWVSMVQFCISSPFSLSLGFFSVW